MSEDTSADIAKALTRARRAQTGWAELPVAERAVRLRAFAPKALAQAEEIAHTIHQETGKPVTEALFAEVLAVADLTQTWTHEIESLLESETVELDPVTYSRKSARIEQHAHGVLGLITPSSSPVVLALRHLLPALLTGNAVLFKPSEHCPESTNVVASLIRPLLPEGLLTVVHGGPDAARAVIDSGVDAITFAGSASAGRQVGAACAQRLIPCSLALDGNDAAIVLADARVERTARGIVWGAFHHAGQSCDSVKRAFIVREAADEIIPRIVALTQSLREGADYGPVTDQKKCDEASEVVSSALERKAEVLTGGITTDDSHRFPPTIVRIDDPQSDLLRHRLPGPILFVCVVDTAEQAVEAANQASSGWTASIWTRRPGRSRSFARRLRTGVVCFNNHGLATAIPTMASFGMAATAPNIENASLTLPHASRPRFVLTDRKRNARELWWYPYDETLHRLVSKAAAMRGGAGFFGRIAAFFALLVLLPKRLFAK